jgi:NADH-quinone oxidoreductase subunit I
VRRPRGREAIEEFTMAFGLGVIKGMGVTLRHYVQTYVVGRKAQPAVAGDLPFPVTERMPAGGMPTATVGWNTVQYPEEKLPVPERFRYLPFLVFDDDPESERAEFDGIRCTSCGICAKVCPPQCIWIVQAKGDDGRPRPVPAAFHIDASVCMSCGFCAEFCPFDAIKMDHAHEFATYERQASWVFDLQGLLHPVAYHAAIHPTDIGRETAERRAKEEARRKKEQAQAQAAPPAGTAAAAGGEAADEAADEARRRRMEARQKMLAERAKREAEQGKAGGDTPAGA